MPKVSIIVPIYNETKEYYQSFFLSVVAQTYQEFECIVIDDSTKSELSEYYRKLCATDDRFQYIKNQKRIGIAASLNLGISRSQGLFIARMDGDDVCCRNRILTQLEFLESNLGIGVVGSAVKLIDEDGSVVGSKKYPKSGKYMKFFINFKCPIAHPVAMFRAEIVEELGGYNDKMLFAEDLDMWLRWTSKGILIHNLSSELVHLRKKTGLRAPVHWLYNIKARFNNLKSTGVFLQVLGILVILCCFVISVPFSITKKIRPFANV